MVRLLSGAAAGGAGPLCRAHMWGELHSLNSKKQPLRVSLLMCTDTLGPKPVTKDMKRHSKLIALAVWQGLEQQVRPEARMTRLSGAASVLLHFPRKHKCEATS